jgi:hypothetical protein
MTSCFLMIYLRNSDFSPHLHFQLCFLLSCHDLLSYAEGMDGDFGSGFAAPEIPMPLPSFGEGELDSGYLITCNDNDSMSQADHATVVTLSQTWTEKDPRGFTSRVFNAAAGHLSLRVKKAVEGSGRRVAPGARRETSHPHLEILRKREIPRLRAPRGLYLSPSALLRMKLR